MGSNNVKRNETPEGRCIQLHILVMLYLREKCVRIVNFCSPFVDRGSVVKVMKASMPC